MRENCHWTSKLNIKMKFGTFNNCQESKRGRYDHNFGVVPLWWRQSETDLLPLGENM